GHKVQLVRVGVTEAVVHTLDRPHDRKGDVLVEEQCAATTDRVAVRLGANRVKQVVAVYRLVPDLTLQRWLRKHALHAGGRIQSVDERGSAGEALGAEQLLVVQSAVRFAELRMPFMRNAAARD